MRTEFTLEEIYDAWSDEIINDMTREYGIVRSVADRIVLSYGLKSQFMEDPERFDFFETTEIARLVYCAIMNEDE